MRFEECALPPYSNVVPASHTQLSFSRCVATCRSARWRQAKSTWEQLLETTFGPKRKWHEEAATDEGRCKKKKFHNENSHDFKAGFSPLILNLGIRWGISVMFHVPDSLPPEERVSVPIEYEAECVGGPVRAFWKKINPLPMLGIEPWFLGPPSRCLVTKLTELSGLLIVCALQHIFIIIFLHQSDLNL